jgi:hypothetical protein
MQFFSWIAANWQTLCGWSMGFYVVYLFGRSVASWVLIIRDVAQRWTNAERVLGRVENLVGVMGDNHLPHLQAELEKSNATLSEISDTLRIMREDQRLLLSEKFITSIREQN